MTINEINIAAFLAIQTAGIQTIQATLEAALKVLGVENIEGLPVSQGLLKRQLGSSSDRRNLDSHN